MPKDKLYVSQFDFDDDVKDNKVFLLSDLQHKKGCNYRLFRKSMRRNGKKETTTLSLIFRWLFLSPLFNLIVDSKPDPHKNSIVFSDFNNECIFVNDSNKWTCPCCKTINIGASHCKNCGVLPKLYRIQADASNADSSI